MSARRKFLFSLLIASAIFLFSPKDVLGATFIFSGAPSTINEKNSFSVDVVLEGLTAGNKYYLRAAFSHPETPSSYFGYTKNNLGIWYNGKPSPIDCTQFFQITMNPDKTWSGSLEVKPDTETAAYKGEGTYNFKIGRYTEAGSGPTWSDNTVQIMITTVTTPTSTPTSSPTPTPTPLPTPTPTPAPTSTSTPSTATYKINEVKDEDDDVLSSVKVYLDDVYLHHYAPETLTFCHGCQCDTYVNCGFGEHTIKLEKSGYDDWHEIKTVNAGDSYEVNPVMTPSGSTPSSTPTPTPSSTPSPSLTGVELETTLSGEILGEEGSPGGIYLLESSTPSPEVLGEKTSKSQILPKIFLIVGSVFLFAAAFFLWYNLLRDYRVQRSDEV